MGYKIMMITGDMLPHLLKPLELKDGRMWAFHTKGLPEDLKFIAASYNLEYDRWECKVESASFPETPPGCCHERFQPEFYKTWVREVTQEEWESEYKANLDKIMNGDQSKPTPQGILYGSSSAWVERLCSVLEEKGWVLTKVEDSLFPEFHGGFNTRVTSTYHGNKGVVALNIHEDAANTEEAIQSIAAGFQALLDNKPPASKWVAEADEPIKLPRQP